MITKKLTIAHIHDTFFAATENFIYHYISNIKYFHVICLASEFVNSNQFPFPAQDLYNIHDRPYDFQWFLWKLLNRNNELEKVVKQNNVGLMHVHFGFNCIYPLRLRKKYEIPLVTTFYGYDISRLTNVNKWRKKYKELFIHGDLFLVEGQHMKSRLIALGCPSNKIQIQRIAIPIERINVVPRKPKKINEKLILIFCGRFVEKKGIMHALEAVERLSAKYNNFEFRIIGDGPLKSKIEKFIKKCHMHNYVKMLGFLTYEDYLKEMQKADIFIHPSFTTSNGDSEGGAPTTILEAQAMGMPVVSTYHADIPNIVVPGESALLSQEKDIDKLTQNINYLFENQQIWERMGSIGREFVEAHHDIKKEIDSLEEKYRSILYSGNR